MLGGDVDAVLGVAIVGVEDGVRIGVVVGGKLGFDVGEGDVAVDADVGAFADLGR